MSGGQEKFFSILGPEFSGSQAQQYYRDKILKIRVKKTHYNYFVFAEAQLMLTQELVYLMTGDSLAGMMDVNISGPEEC